MILWKNKICVSFSFEKYKVMILDRVTSHTIQIIKDKFK